jgi:hypothetical protein
MRCMPDSSGALLWRVVAISGIGLLATGLGAFPGQWASAASGGTMVAARTRESEPLKGCHCESSSAGLAEGILGAWFYLVLMGWLSNSPL